MMRRDRGMIQVSVCGPLRLSSACRYPFLRDIQCVAEDAIAHLTGDIETLAYTGSKF
jgi:hypothetical protein